MKLVTRKKVNFRFIWAQFFDFAFYFKATSNYRRDEQMQLDQIKSAIQKKETKNRMKKQPMQSNFTNYTFDKGLTSGLHEELKQLNSKK